MLLKKNASSMDFTAQNNIVVFGEIYYTRTLKYYTPTFKFNPTFHYWIMNIRYQITQFEHFKGENIRISNFHFE